MVRVFQDTMIQMGPPGEGMDPGQVAELESAIAPIQALGAAEVLGSDGTDRRPLRLGISADWFSDINQAIEKARNVAEGGAGILHLSAGVTNYSTSDGEAVRLKSGDIIEGEDPATSRIVNLNADATLLTVDTPGDLCDRPILRNLRLYGGNVAAVGVDWRGITRGRLDNIEISGFTETQLWFGGDSDTYNAGWNNTLFTSRITAPANGSAVRFSGVTGTGAPTANRNEFFALRINGLSQVGAIGIDLQEGDTNKFWGGDIGYGEEGIPFLLGVGAYMNEFHGGVTEGTLFGADISGTRNLFIGWTFPAASTSTVRVGARDNEFAHCPETGTIVNEDGDANRTRTSGIQQEESFSTRKFIANSSSTRSIQVKVAGDADNGMAILGNGSIRFYDPATGATVTTLKRANVAAKAVEWDDGTIVHIPKHTAIPGLASSRRGAMLRIEGASGAPDITYLLDKDETNAYGVRQVGLEPVITKTASFTAASLLSTIYLVDASAGAVTATLPTAIGRRGVRHTFKKTDASANAVTIDPASTQTVDGQLTHVLSNQYDMVKVVSDDANWLIIS